MGKQATEEQRYQVLSRWYQGYTRDQIAKITGLSKGSVSNILKDFKEKMEKGDFEAIQVHARLNRQLKLDHQKMLDGHRTNQILEKNGVTLEKLNFVIESCGKINSGDITSLLETASQIQEEKQETDKTIKQVGEIFVFQSAKISEQEEQIKLQQQQLEKIFQQIQDTLEDADATQEILDEFVIANKKLDKVGLSVLDFVRAPSVLEEFARNNFDPKKIVRFFEKVQDLSKTAKLLETKIQNLQQEITQEQTNLSKTTQDLNSLNEKYKNYSKTIKIIQSFIDSNQDPHCIVNWEGLLRSAGVDIGTFDSKLQEHNGIVNLLRDLKDNLRALDSQKVKLVEDTNSISKILQQLQNNKDTLEKNITEMLQRAENEVSKYEDSNPLRIIRDPNCDPQKAMWIIFSFMKDLKNSQCLTTNKNASRIQGHLDALIDDFERGIQSK